MSSLSTSESHSAEHVVYVSVGGESRIDVYKMNSKTGLLKKRSHVDLPGAPGSLSISTDGTKLYSALRSVKGVGTLSINGKTGDLKFISSTPVVDNPVYIITEKTGKFLLTSYYGAGKAAVFPIQADGTIGKNASCIVETEKNPHSLQADRSNNFVYVPNTGSDSVLQYKLNKSDGTLTPLNPAKVSFPPLTGPRHFSFHPSNKFVYFVNEKGSSVTFCTLNSKTGQLEIQQTISTLPKDFEGKNSTADIHVTPDGKYVYGSNRGHDSLAGYAIDQKTGMLTSLGQFPTEKTPREFDIDPTGRFVYSAGQGSGKMIAYKIQDNGHLKPLETYEVGKSPSWVLVAPVAK